jgi:type I restriction enzyme S subunit
LFYYLQSQKDSFIALGKGGAQPNISQTVLKEYPLPLPSLPEQQRIVNVIEALFAKLDRAKELLEEVQDAFKEQKATILARAFRGELTAKWRAENCVNTKLEYIGAKKLRCADGNIPNGWQWEIIGNVGEVRGGKRLPKGMRLTKYNTGFPYIKAGDLKNGTVMIDNLEYITKDIHTQIKNYTVVNGDVYITIVGACIGDVGIIPETLSGANLTENAAKITNLHCNGQYLAYCLSSASLQTQIKAKTASATLGKLSLHNIREIVFPIPPIKEQQEIVRILENLLDQSSAAASLCDQIEQIDQLKKAILAKAFRGELNTNDSAEESAEKLLREVLQQRATVGANKASAKRKG